MLLVGLTLFVLASFGCALVDSLSWLLVLRFVQALGGALVNLVPAVSPLPMCLVMAVFGLLAALLYLWPVGSREEPVLMSKNGG